MYSLARIAQIVDGELIGSAEGMVKHLVYDSRKIGVGESSLFFCLRTESGDGHRYIDSVIKAKILAVVVEYKVEREGLNQIIVKDSKSALQKLAAYHRKQFKIPVIGITGSNGKTIVKEWLAQILSDYFKVHKSPKSYNSQIGVPLSIWPLNSTHEIAIIEAGISKKNEMHQLEKIIKPSIGIFTHLGDAHGIHFSSKAEKLKEKLELFKYSDSIICEWSEITNHEVENLKATPFYWGDNDNCHLQICEKEILRNESRLTVSHNAIVESFIIPFTDQASIDNIMSVISACLLLGLPLNELKTRIAKLKAIDMRLQQVQGINDNSLILDYYNADLQSLSIALDFQQQQHNAGLKVVIVSDILEGELSDDKIYIELDQMLKSKKIDLLIGIGDTIINHQSCFKIKSEFYSSTQEFLDQFPLYTIKNSSILIKGARPFEFEKIVEHLSIKSHQTILEVNMSRLQQNLNIHKKQIGTDVKIMAMVKAFSYGSGGYQIAKLLEYNKLDYLGVAYVDEGTSLRRSGIQTPIMVLNTDFSKSSLLIEYNLEPVIYSIKSLKSLIAAIQSAPIKVHVEFDTGMHRLGFEPTELSELLSLLKQHDNIQIASVFSHLAVADEADKKQFTQEQIHRYTAICSELEKSFDYPIIKHIANSAGVQNFPESSFDMVRLGIGLYGIGSNQSFSKELMPVGTFKSYIAQIRTVKAGEGISYGLHDSSNVDRQIAIIAVGYADGLNRLLSRNNGHFNINGQKANIVGNVCMDMSMCDVSDIECKEGDEVIIFGDSPRVEEVAKQCQTIPYEVLTSVSERVNRIFYQE